MKLEKILRCERSENRVVATGFRFCRFLSGYGRWIYPVIGVLISLIHLGVGAGSGIKHWIGERQLKHSKSGYV